MLSLKTNKERLCFFFSFSITVRWQRNSGGGQRLFSTPLSVLTSSSLSPPLSLSKTGPGTRPGPGGAPLISTGVAGLDSALGGGLPLGRLLLLESDGGGGGTGSSPTADALARLFVAEGVAGGQRVAWVQSCSVSDAAAACEEEAEEEEEEQQRWWIPGRAVPRSSSGERGARSGGGGDVAAAAPAPRGREHNGNGKPEERDDEGSDLKIAWQYRRYIASARAAREEEEQRREEAARAERRRRRQLEEGGGGGNAPPSRSSRSSSSSSSSSSSLAVKAWCHDFDLTRRTLCPGFREGFSRGEEEATAPSSSSLL